MRIIAGRHRGRRIQAPPGLATRPTSDRAREALVGILEHGSPPLAGSRFLDLFAGSGAVGLEAASRGAEAVLLVENDPAAVATIRKNIEHLGETGRVRLLVADASRLGPAREPFDLVFLDPPWRSGLAGPALDSLLAGGWLSRESRVVVELAADEPFMPSEGFELEQERRYGRTRFVFLRLVGTRAPRPTRRRARRTPADDAEPGRPLATGSSAPHLPRRDEKGLPC